MKLHHIGYVVNRIEDMLIELQTINYQVVTTPHTHTINDEIQRCRICFVEREGEPLIELVEPYENNKSLRKMLAQRGNSPYHLCYEVGNVETLFDELSGKEGWVPLFRPIEAPALNNRLIVYFYNAQLGYIEFVNDK